MTLCSPVKNVPPSEEMLRAWLIGFASDGTAAVVGQ